MSRSQRADRSDHANRRRWLHRFAILTASCTWVLIWAGGLVTSTGSGLAVPDWPLSYGMLMPPMVGGILYEHGHRMVATLVGLLTTILAIWLWRSEPRRWVRRLGAAALAMVITQGLLGGITVIFLLPTPISITHATLAQTFFCVVVLLAFATSKEWESAAGMTERAHPSLRTVALIATGVIYVQLILGATVRHTGAALAIPDFPLVFGGLAPPLDTAPVAIHFTHRVFALVVVGALGWLVSRIWREHSSEPRFTRPAILLSCLVVVQVLLGGTIVWTSRAVFPATAHVATGALLLATSWLLTLRAFLHLAPVATSSMGSMSVAENRGLS